jgi:N-acetylmuramoyl-L-alanine amidase
VTRTVGDVVVVGNLPLRAGASGEAVADLQRRLNGLGHSTGDDLPGTFGPSTEAAVREFQQKRGLREDGICGDETWSTLVDAGHELGDRLLYERVPMLRGDDVADLQRQLGELGFDAGRVDGFFGPATAHAVVEFQRNAGLPTDGVCGPDTLEAIRRVSGRTGIGSTVARIREADAIRRTPPGLAGRRIAVADGGEATGLTDALGWALRSAGAVVSVIHHPDEGEQAEAANSFEAAVFVGVAVRDEPGVELAYYAREDFESIGGRRLAEMIADALDAGPTQPERPARGMRLRILRETRMPAVEVEIGPPTVAVEHAPRFVQAIAAAITRWTTEPLD